MCYNGRESNNWGQYQTSMFDPKWPGGGGFSILVFSLGALFQEHERIRNTWTKSNEKLPLCRYNGVKFTFWRQPDIDYIVYYSRCFPMLDTEMQHTNAQPSAMMLRKHKIVVLSRQKKPRSKPYVKKFIKPPAQMLNKWYFQKELCNTNLVMLTTSLTSFDNWFINPMSVNDNITLWSLNTTIFLNRNFQLTDMGTGYWTAKNNFYMYAQPNGSDSPIHRKNLIYIGNPKENQPGIPRGNRDWSYYNRTSNFGSPFWHEYLNKDKPLYVSTTDPKTLFAGGDDDDVSDKLTRMTQELIIPCRYNPYRDTGEGNIVYLKKNTKDEQGWELPSDPNIQYDGFPLWLLLFGWTDWQKKLHAVQQLDLNYIVTIRSDFFDQKLPAYVFVDRNFIDGHSLYDPDEQPPESHQLHWYPKYLYQQKSINTICTSGPGMPRLSTKSVECKCNYKFHFKFGGCPAEMETVKDPCHQPQYPVPSNLIEKYEIENPEKDPKDYIYTFDERRSLITKKCCSRLQKELTTEIFSPTVGNKTNPNPAPPTQEIQTPTSEKNEEALLQQLIKLRNEHQLLRYRIKQLT